jgi:hypothetical protein
LSSMKRENKEHHKRAWFLCLLWPIGVFLTKKYDVPYN